MATAVLAEMKAAAELRLPAQVVVPPSQIEVDRRAGAGHGDRGARRLRRDGEERPGAGPAAGGASCWNFSAISPAPVPQAGAGRREPAARRKPLRRRHHRQRPPVGDARRRTPGRAAVWPRRRQALRLAGAAEPDARTASLSGSADIRAPFDGVVLEASAQAGQRVDAMTPLFKLGRISPLWLEIQAAPAQAAGIAPGDAVGCAGCCPVRPGHAGGAAHADRQPVAC